MFQHVLLGKRGQALLGGMQHLRLTPLSCGRPLIVFVRAIDCGSLSLQSVITENAF